LQSHNPKHLGPPSKKKCEDLTMVTRSRLRW